MIKTIFLDMDGVIVDFVGGVNKRMGIPKDTIPTKWAWVEDYGFTLDQVNSWCTLDFWANLEWMHDGRDILRAIMNTVGLEKVYLLTAPMPNLESASGKMMWVSGNLPICLKRTIIVQAPKSLLANPNTLLIDDKDENVEKFVTAGGNAILVPRPWNKGYKNSDVSSQIVEQELKTYSDLGDKKGD